METVIEKKHGDLENTEIPIDSEGRTMHLGANKHESISWMLKKIVANRILCVGDFNRCEQLATRLTNAKKTISKRGFVTHTGFYKKVPVSVACAGMGIPNTDFLIREARQVIEGPMAMLRFGTCGAVNPSIVPGDIIIPKDCILVQQNYDYDPKTEKPENQFYISKECPGDEKLHDLLVKKACELMGESVIHKDGIMATAETFYSGQGEEFQWLIGRRLERFTDSSDSLHDILHKKYPRHESFEMEMYCLYKLAELSDTRYKIYSGGLCVGIFNRKTGGITGSDLYSEREEKGGIAALETLIAFEFPEGEPSNTKELSELLSKLP